MKENSKLMVNFNLNEVRDNFKSHLYNDCEDILEIMFNDFYKFLTSYAPYTIVSDMASNCETFDEEGYSESTLGRVIDLEPKTFQGKILKSAVLSEARAAFGFGLFPSEEKESDDYTDKDIAKIEHAYESAKDLSSRGFNLIARFLSFLYAFNHLSLHQINAIGRLVKSYLIHLNGQAMAGIIGMSLLFSKSDEFVKFIRLFMSKINDLAGKWDDADAIDYRMSDYYNGVLNIILMSKVISNAYFAVVDEDSVDYGEVLINFISSYMDNHKADAYRGLYQFNTNRSNYNSIGDFIEKLVNILNI